MKGSEKKIKLFLLSLIIIIGVLFVIPDYVLIQPGLPSDPEQTPIDGGLGILGALGGVYAIKKLRN